MRRMLPTFWGLLLPCFLWFCTPVRAAQQESAPEEPPAEEQATEGARTNDPLLQDQINELQGAFNELTEQINQYQETIEREPSVARRSGLSTQLGLIQKEYDEVDRVLRRLKEEARAIQWTAADEALKRARPFDRSQEEDTRREETLRERLDQ